MQTLEQKFAVLIYDRVSAYASRYPDKNSSERTQYGSMAHKLPILVYTSGLTQALAFVESRGNPAQHSLLEDLAQVTAECDKPHYLELSRNSGLQDYVYLTRKTLIALKWFKRFAQSVLEVDATANDKTGGTNAS